MSFLPILCQIQYKSQSEYVLYYFCIFCKSLIGAVVSPMESCVQMNESGIHFFPIYLGFLSVCSERGVCSPFTLFSWFIIVARCREKELDPVDLSLLCKQKAN